MRMIVAAALACSLPAQTPSTSPEGVKDIMRFLDLTGGFKEGEKTLSMIEKDDRPIDKEMTEDAWAEYARLRSLPELGTRTIAIYFDSSREEIQAWTAFFESRPGQAYLSKCEPADPRITSVALRYFWEIRGQAMMAAKNKK